MNKSSSGTTLAAEQNRQTITSGGESRVRCYILFSIELYLRMVYYFFEQLVHCLLLIRYVWFIFFQVSGPKHGLLHVHGLLNVKSISQRPSNTYD